MRILHVIPSLGIGGSQRLALDLIAALAETGMEQHLCVLGRKENTYSGYTQKSSVVYLEYSGNYRSLSETRNCASGLCNEIRRTSPDIVHSYMWLGDVLGAYAAWRTKTPHLSHIVDRRRFLEAQTPSSWIRKVVTLWLFRRARTRFVAVSDACRKYFAYHAGYTADRIAVAWNSIPLEPYTRCMTTDVHKRNNGIIGIGFAGRLVGEKGLGYLLRALAIMSQRPLRPYEVRIVGRGTLRPDLEKMTEDLKLREHVRFEGTVDDMPGFYGGIDIFVVPSVAAEGLPTTILEAMASNCAVIASDVGGAAEAICHNESGIVIPPGEEKILADALTELVEDDSLRRRLAAAGRIRVEALFNIKTMARSIHDVYHDILRNEQ